MTKIQFGAQVPNRGPMTDPECIRAIVTEAEALDFGVLIVSDHIVVPKDIDSRYPYSEAGDFPGGEFGECMEQLTLLSYVAALTRKAKIMTSVMVVPHREPLLAAKSLATTDKLSGGRVIVGVGTGWMREEFEAIGAPDFAKRGEVTDDYLRIFKKVWTDDNAEHDSPYSTFSNIAFQPKPVQSPHPPIWIGGESGRAHRRVVELGDGWYPIGANPANPLDTIDRYKASRDRLHARAEKAGRDPSTIGLAFNAPFHAQEEAKNSDGDRMIMTGSAQNRAADIAALKDLGVTKIVVNTQAAELPASLDRMREFQGEVVSLVS
jgi:probable F420-dependent oxidoreductase